jgi:hypothetical protein
LIWDLVTPTNDFPLKKRLRLCVTRINCSDFSKIMN